MKDLSTDARRLIDVVGGSDGPSAARRRSVKQRLSAQLAASGVALSASQLAAAASHQASTALVASAVGKVGLGAGTVALWLFGGALVGTLVMAPIALTTTTETSAPGRGAVSAQSVARALPAKPAAAAVIRELPALVQPESAGVLGPESAVEAESLRSRDRRQRAPRALPEAAQGSGGSTAFANVGAESALLESAQRELAAGQGERALALLQRHEAEFPNAALSEERAAARVIALCQLGRNAEAHASAEALVRVAPRSPLLPRLRKSCAFAADIAGGGKP